MRVLAPYLVLMAHTAMAPAVATVETAEVDRMDEVASKKSPKADRKHHLRPAPSTCDALGRLADRFLKDGELDSAETSIMFMRRDDIGCIPEADKLEQELEELKRERDKPEPAAPPELDDWRILQG